MSASSIHQSEEPLPLGDGDLHLSDGSGERWDKVVFGPLFVCALRTEALGIGLRSAGPLVGKPRVGRQQHG